MDARIPRSSPCCFVLLLAAVGTSGCMVEAGYSNLFPKSDTRTQIETNLDVDLGGGISQRFGLDLSFPFTLFTNPNEAMHVGSAFSCSQCTHQLSVLPNIDTLWSDLFSDLTCCGLFFKHPRAATALTPIFCHDECRPGLYRPISPVHPLGKEFCKKFCNEARPASTAIVQLPCKRRPYCTHHLSVLPNIDAPRLDCLAT